MGGPGLRQFVAPAALPGAALQPASFSIRDLEEHQGGPIIFKMSHEVTYRPADPGDFAQPRVMKTLPGATTATSAPVARVLQSACCSQSSRDPLGGISKAKEGGRRIQEHGGMAA